MNICKKCLKSYVYYDSACVWFARCDLLGSSIKISDYTEDEDEAPDWEEDLGQSNPYCILNAGGVINARK